MTNAEQIKRLREQTGAGVLDAKRALDHYDGDFDKALSSLRAKGMEVAEKKAASRTASDGLIETYVHGGGTVGVMVEVNCETDFVARTDDFKQLAHNVALQIAAMNPLYVSPELIPAEVLERKKHDLEAASSGLSTIPKILENQLEKWYSEVCLLRQPYIRDDSITIDELVKTVSAKTREKIVVRRFARYQLGE